ncbi:hypothetical protein [Arthrobacter sp. NIO-1057]|uniref:hypothetical protein n=1 Tax=Arthrobacter sp. NIO-1057 TaxID=993071 RepID=UPI0008183F9B|nr:hypothetical protein [Arthrobacter sp. NIO-1057]SCC51138.1 hypothetical protein GA0061084_3191 [Arthrobacter sp. NIO-1057]
MTSAMTYTQLTDLSRRIGRSPELFQAYMLGKEHGYKQGWADADDSAENHAEHAARLFYTMEAGEEWQRKAARSAHDAIDVVASREKMKRGDSR